MLNHACPCGDYTCFGSMPPPPCVGCEKCGSVATLDHSKREPAPHDWTVEQVETDEGTKTLTYCSRCAMRKSRPANPQHLVAAKLRAGLNGLVCMLNTVPTGYDKDARMALDLIRQMRADVDQLDDGGLRI